MGNYGSLNVLANKKIKDFMSDDAIQDASSLINASGANRAQRKRLERALRKTENIMEYTQKHVNQKAFKEYQYSLDEMMVRFFSVLGIVLKNQYNFEESEEKEDISHMFDMLNTYLEEYRELSTSDVARICFETTGLELIAE